MDNNFFRESINFASKFFTVILFPNAKINLGLRVLSKRNDGYHNIETLVIETGLCDILEFIEARDGIAELTLSGRQINGQADENLVMKVWKLMHEKYAIPAVKIHLHKIIPQGSGLGGGSSDAAFMLKGLNEYFKLNISVSRLRLLASTIGSDCSFFIDNKPAILEGKGDILTPSPKFIQNYWLYIFYTELFVSTAEAYENIIPVSSRKNLVDILFGRISDWKETLINDFEPGIFTKYPLLAQIKQKVYESGAVYSAMSGSGSSVIGVYKEKPVLKDDLKQWILWEEFIQNDQTDGSI